MKCRLSAGLRWPALCSRLLRLPAVLVAILGRDVCRAEAFSALSQLWFSHFQISWLDVMSGLLIIHSSQPQWQSRAHELCDFLCFLPSLPIFLASLLVVGSCPLPQIRSVSAGSKAAGFDSQPHPGETTILTALCEWGIQTTPAKKAAVPIFLSKFWQFFINQCFSVFSPLVHFRISK